MEQQQQKRDSSIGDWGEITISFDPIFSNEFPRYFSIANGHYADLLCPYHFVGSSKMTDTHQSA
jgi:hypothetical protein